MLKIREYTHKDVQALRRQVADLHEAMRVLDPSLPPVSEIIDTYFEYLLQTSKSSGGTFYLAEVDGEMIGYLCLFGLLSPSDPDEPPEPYSFVADLYVRPEFQRRGIGKALMETAEEHARALGASNIDLKILTPNKHALAFYQALGYGPRILELRKPIRARGQSGSR